MAAAERDLSDGYRSPSVGPQRLGTSAARTANPGTFGRGPRFGPPPQSAARARSAGLVSTYAAKSSGGAASSSPLRQGGYSGMAQTRMGAFSGGATQPRSKTPAALRSLGGPSPYTVPGRRAQTPPSRLTAKYTAPTAPSISLGRRAPAAGPDPGRRLIPPARLRGPAAAVGYPSASPRTPGSSRYTPTPRAGRSPPPRDPVWAYASPSPGTTARGRGLAYGDTPTAAAPASVPGATYTAGGITRAGGRGPPTHRSARPVDANGRFQDPGDDWLTTYERSSMTFIQELEGILGGLTRLGGLTPAPMEARAPPLQFPTAMGRLAGGIQSVAAVPAQQLLPQAADQAGYDAAVGSSGRTAAGDTAADHGRLPGAATPSQQAAHAGIITTLDALPANVLGWAQPAQQPQIPPQPTAAAASPAGHDVTRAAAAVLGSAGAVSSPALLSLPPGTLGELWSVLQASNQNTARLMADLAAARREVELANERAEEADGLARMFQQQLIQRQQHVASWQTALVEVEEREVAAKQQLVEATERCGELAQRAQQAERVAATAQLRLERLVAQRAARLEAGSEQGREQMAGEPDPGGEEKGLRPQEAAQQLKHQLQHLRADLAAAQTRATRTELELAVARNKALIAQQELSSEEERARRAAAVAATAREELGRTRSALELMGRDHDRLQHQLEELRGKLTVRDEHWQRSDQSPLPSSAGGRQFSPWRPAVPLEGASTAQATSADSASAGARTPTVTTAAGHDGAAATVLAEPAGEARQGSSAVAEADFSQHRHRLASVLNGRRASDSSASSSDSSSGSSGAFRALTGDVVSLLVPPPPAISGRQRWGSLLLLAPGEMPADTNASARYGQRLPMRRRSRSQDMGLVEVSGGGGSGSSWLRGARGLPHLGVSPLGVADASSPAGGMYGRDTSPRLGMQLRVGTHDGVVRRPTSEDRTGDGEMDAFMEAHGADGGDAEGSDEEKGSGTDPESLQSPQAGNSLRSGVHRNAVSSALIEEMLPLSRTPSSGARRRMSIHRASIGSSLRGAAPPAAITLPAQTQDSGVGSPGSGGGVWQEPMPASAAAAAAARKRTAGEAAPGQAQPWGQEAETGRTQHPGINGSVLAAGGPAAGAVAVIHGLPHLDGSQDQLGLSLADLRRQMAAGNVGGGSDTSSAGTRRTSLSFATKTPSAADNSTPVTLQQQVQQRQAMAAARAASVHSDHGDGSSSTGAGDGSSKMRLPLPDYLPPLEKSYSPPERPRHGNSPASSPLSRIPHPPVADAAANHASVTAAALHTGLTFFPHSPHVSPLPQPPRAGAVPAAAAGMGLPQGYHTSHHNDLYESIQSRWPGAAASSPSQEPCAAAPLDLAKQQDHQLDPAQGRAITRLQEASSDAQNGGDESLMRQVVFTSRSRMLSPSQLDSYRVSASVTASMAAVASIDGGFRPGGDPPRMQQQVMLRAMAAANRTLNTTMELGKDLAGQQARDSAEERSLVRPPMAAVAAGSSSVGNRSTDAPAGLAVTLPQRQPPWWRRLWRRKERHATGHSPGREDACADGSAVSTGSQRPEARVGNGPTPAPPEASRAAGQPAEAGATSAQGKDGSVGRRWWPRRRGGDGDGNNLVQSVLLHVGVWSGGVAFGVLIVLGMAGVVEGTLGLGGEANRGVPGGDEACNCPPPKSTSRASKGREKGITNIEG